MTVDQKQLFVYLKKQKKAVLLECLRSAYEELSVRQRRAVFGDADLFSPSPLDGEALWEEVRRFRDDSLCGRHPALCRPDPERVDEWCADFADLARETCRLSAQGDHDRAVRCFVALYEVYAAVGPAPGCLLVEGPDPALDPAETREWVEAYLISLAETTTAEEYVEIVAPFVRRESYHSRSDEAAQLALAAANCAQRACLEAELKRQKLRDLAAQLGRAAWEARFGAGPRRPNDRSRSRR